MMDKNHHPARHDRRSRLCFAQEQFTYKMDAICSQRFCDAFFENDSICANSGDGSAFIYEDGNCGIDILGPAEVTCRVKCRQDTESSVVAVDVAVDVVIAVLALGAVGYILAPRCRWRILAEQQNGGKNMTMWSVRRATSDGREPDR
jgi:hypothetical protein